MCTLSPSNPSHPGYIPHRSVFLYALKGLEKNAHSGTIESSPKLEMAEMPINNRIDNTAVNAHTQNEQMTAKATCTTLQVSCCVKEARHKWVRAMQFCSREGHNQEKLIYAVGRLVRTLVTLVKEVTRREYKGHLGRWACSVSWSQYWWHRCVQFVKSHLAV